MPYIIEIATANYTSTQSAIMGGASRIELCSALSEGGLTPSHAYLKTCRENFAIPLFPIIRPRGGDFLYTNEEFEIIKKEVIFCRDTNFDGVVTGFLQRDGSIDKERISTIVALAHPMEVTFHRAFDRCRDPFEAMEDIIQAGCRRILTSGQQASAPDGGTLIQQLILAAAHRITIMPGSGVRKENIAALAKKTKATEFHSSLRSTVNSGMSFHHPNFSNIPEEFTIETVVPRDVKELFAALYEEENDS